MVTNINTLKAKREELAQKARAIVAANGGNGLKGITPEQLTNIKSITAEIRDIDTQIGKHDESQRLLDSIQGPAPVDEKGRPITEAKTAAGDRVYLDRSASTLRTKAATARDLIRTKELIAAGTQPIATPLLDKPVMLPGQSAFTLSQLLPRKAVTSPVYQYLRQTLREHNAAVVPVGGLKPTSRYGFETVKGELSTIAHLSEPFHEFWANDFPEAVDALLAELLNGIFEADEDLILNGDGVGDNPRGLLNTSGIQTQAFVTNKLTTTRTAITKLEVLGHSAGAFVLNPLDWQDIELSRNESGQLEYSSGPISRAEMRLWGVPVATSTKVAAGSGLALDLDAAHVLTKGDIEMVSTNAVADDFAHNQIRVRAEHRFDVAVTKPSGIVVMTLSTP